MSRVEDEVGEVLERDRPTAARRNREHASAEVVAADPLDEAGVDAPARLALERDSRLVRFDDHAVDEAAVDVQRESGDQRVFGEREHELAVEDAIEVVPENERGARARRQTVDGHLIARLLDGQRRRRRVAVLADEQRRRPRLTRPPALYILNGV